MSDSIPSLGQNIETGLPLSVKLEALLFGAAEPVTPAQLAASLDVSVSVVERGLNELDASLSSRGLRLQRHSGRVQLTTAPQLADEIERFLGLEATTRLSRAALETQSFCDLEAQAITLQTGLIKDASHLIRKTRVFHLMAGDIDVDSDG